MLSFFELFILFFKFLFYSSMMAFIVNSISSIRIIIISDLVSLFKLILFKYYKP